MAQRSRKPQKTPGALRTIGEIPRAVRQGRVARLYVLFGQERYLLNRLLEELLEALLPKDDPWRAMNLEHRDGETLTLRELQETAETVPMGTQRRVVVVRNPAFLGGNRTLDPVATFRRAWEAAEAGDRKRALELFYQALDVPPTSLDDATVRARIEAFRKTLAEQDPALVSVLDAFPEQLGDLPIPEAPADESDVEAFLRWVAQGVPESTTLVLTLSERPPQKLLGRLEKFGVLADVDSLKERGSGRRDPVEAFLHKQVQAAGKRIEPEAAALLRHRSGDNLQLLVDELEKLIAYVQERDRITVEDVASVVSDGSTASVFALTDAFGSRRAPEAVGALYRLLRQGEPPLKVLAMLVRHVRLMLQAKLLWEEQLIPRVPPQMTYRTFLSSLYRQWPQEAVERLPASPALNLLKQKPYACFVALRDANYYTRGELERALKILAEVDFTLKSARVEESVLLTGALLRCMGLPDVRGW